MSWWVLTFLQNTRTYTSLLVQAQTNLADHLFMSWSRYKPSRTRVYRTVRGKIIFCGYKYTWDTPNVIEQNEPGDTINHTFSLISLQPTDHVWYYLWSIAGPYGQPCQGPLIHVLPPELPMPSARVFHSVEQAIPISATTPVAFDSERWDDGNFHDPADPTKLSISIPGLYLIGACIRFATVAPNNYRLYLRLNDTTYLIEHNHTGGATSNYGTALTVETIYHLQPGDFIQAIAYHDSALPRNIYALQAWTPEFWIAYLGPYPS